MVSYPSKKASPFLQNISGGLILESIPIALRKAFSISRPLPMSPPPKRPASSVPFSTFSLFAREFIQTSCF